MRTYIYPIICLLAINLAGGCATDNASKAALETAARMGDVRGDLVKVKQRVDSMQAALNDLVFSPATDLKPQFETFEANFKETAEQARVLTARADQMEKAGDELLAAWLEKEAAITGDATKARSLDLRRQIGRERVAMNESFAAARKSFDPYMQDLNDTIDYLKNNLNPDGISDIREMAEQANIDAKTVTANIDTAISKLDVLRSRSK